MEWIGWLPMYLAPAVGRVRYPGGHIAALRPGASDPGGRLTHLGRLPGPPGHREPAHGLLGVFRVVWGAIALPSCWVACSVPACSTAGWPNASSGRVNRFACGPIFASSAARSSSLRVFCPVYASHSTCRPGRCGCGHPSSSPMIHWRLWFRCRRWSTGLGLWRTHRPRG